MRSSWISPRRMAGKCSYHADLTAADLHYGMEGSRFNPLLFWDKLKMRFPLHYLLAMRVICNLPTEANCERVFSAAGGTMSHLRRSLGSKNLEAMVIVGAYFKTHDKLEE